MLLVVLAIAPACRSGAPQASPELQVIVQSTPRGVDTRVWADVQKFYDERQHALAWSDPEGKPRRAEQAMAVLRNADAHGLDSARYGLPDLSAQQIALASTTADGQDHAQRRAKFDVQLTTALLRLGRDVATGALDPRIVDSRWNRRRDPPDLVGALSATASGPASSASSFLDSVAPRHPEYKALHQVLASLRQQMETGWPAVPRVAIRPGQRHAAVVPLRQRLAIAGFLAGDAGDSTLCDTSVQAAVRAFQEHHALTASGVLDSPTLTALNVPLQHRIAQVAMNLERWRWMPDDLGARHLLVNIPHFHLIARENGKPVFDVRVVVGKPGNETPTFSDEMTHVVFSPYWNIPETIAIEETVPAIAGDPSYLARNNMEVVDAAGQVVAASAVPWDDEQALRTLSFRQRPGSNNALGHVKFMFPNQHNVYIHDTPADALFARIGRALSHGCVRVEEPEALAQYVLRDQPEWTPQAIGAAMRAGEEQHVKLTATIPVHIVYLTAWVDPSGGLHFQDDVYGYDARQARASRGAGLKAVR